MSDNIKKLPPNSKGQVRYRFVVDVGRDVNGKRRQLTVTKDTLKEAREERSRIMHEHSAGTYVAPTKLTVTEWLDEWLEKKKRDVELTTIRAYKMALIHVHEQLGHIRLQDLTEDQVQDFVDWLLATGRKKGGVPGTGLRPSTVEGILIRLREALGRAVVRKLCTTNAAQYVKIPLAARKADRREKKTQQPWTVEEVQKFIKGLEGDRLYAPLLLSLMGLRPAEVCGARWIDVDLELGTLETTNTRTMLGNHEVLEKDTKTEAGGRVLPLPSKAAEALKKFKAQQAKEKLAMGGFYVDSGYILVNKMGEPLNTRRLRERAYSLMESQGLRKVRLYDARHSCLTYLAVYGVPDVVLAAWAGHTSAAFTKRKYVHPGVNDLRPAAEAWDAFHSKDADEL